MNNKEKARQLYNACKTDPHEDTLLPVHYFNKNSRDILYRAMIVGTLINRYATGEYDDDFVQITKENFYVGDWDKEGWKSTLSSIYRLEKKKIIETTEKNGKKFIRLTSDDFFNPEIYKRKELEIIAD